MIRRATLIVGSVFVLAPSWVDATPSTTFWGPSTALCQGFGVPHVTYGHEQRERKKTGALIGGVTPDVQIGLKGLKKLNLAGDLQTGKNVLGAWGFGSNVYFADNVSLLLGPVFFLDRNLQPGGSKWMFSAQLDIDINFGK